MFARFLKGFVLTPVLAGSLVLTAGCTSEPGDVSDAPTIPSDPAEQPYDLFLGEQLGIVDYAQRKVRNQCLAEAGYRQNLEVMAARTYREYFALGNKLEGPLRLLAGGGAMAAGQAAGDSRSRADEGRMSTCWT